MSRRDRIDLGPPAKVQRHVYTASCEDCGIPLYPRHVEDVKVSPTRCRDCYVKRVGSFVRRVT